MANPSRPLAPLQASSGARSALPLRRRWLIAGAVLVVLLVLAWFEGGERDLRPIEEPVALPGAIR
ncbi:hypothetical protein [Porphyrobacter sp. LM 6]|uniref:hypothetical protein n=1 Tax=Porphyrobacter sp. LM 6 TaxID=1896196 RepID=UPI000846FB73|nr:hypothetical protein [Porphyrobacter sp. LM 6]AOL94636.1 hypothetical protein BG023_111710 [Porphyrobacter sp. LM 6]